MVKSHRAHTENKALQMMTFFSSEKKRFSPSVDHGAPGRSSKTQMTSDFTQANQSSSAASGKGSISLFQIPLVFQGEVESKG